MSAESATPFTKSYIPQGMYDNFKVCAVMEKDGTKTVVMNGYDVRFINDDWSYVSDTQRLMYWNSFADRYLFTAGAPISAVTAMSATSMTLHLENNTTESAMAAEPLKIEYGSAEFGKTVNLRFAYAHCSVCVAFVRNDTKDIAVTEINLTPGAAITSKANLKYNYDWSTTPAKATVEVTSTEKSTASLSFANVSIPANTGDAIVSETRYYCVPDALNADSWTVSLKCNGEEKSAQFVNSEAWQSGKNYIYMFSLEGKSPKLVKVITQDDFFDCNDIVSGGEFSGFDMTE
ncbi:MAG: fimbrillin family protein [Prevotella sp.]